MRIPARGVATCYSLSLWEDHRWMGTSINLPHGCRLTHENTTDDADGEQKTTPKGHLLILEVVFHQARLPEGLQEKGILRSMQGRRIASSDISVGRVVGQGIRQSLVSQQEWSSGQGSRMHWHETTSCSKEHHSGKLLGGTDMTRP